jgi:hypothetical protein
VKSVTRDKVYEGPVRKVSCFFEKGHDQWKAKCRATKTLVKRLESRVRLFEESRGRWKKRAKELQAKAARMEVKGRKFQKEFGGPRTKGEPTLSWPIGHHWFLLLGDHKLTCPKGSL